MILLTGKRTMNKFWNFSNESSDVAELSIFDEIGFFGVTSGEFFNELKEVAAPKIIVHINSPGGAVFEGFAIYNLLRNHPAKIEVRVQGIAASIASVIAMAADEIVMPENSFLMIHNPSMFAFGESKDFRKNADMLDMIKENVLAAYMSKSGVGKETVSSWMDEEKFFTAVEAVDVGLADRLEEAVEVAARFDFQEYYPGKSCPMALFDGKKVKTKGDRQMKLDEALARISTLEAEGSQLKVTHEKQIAELTASNTKAVSESVATALKEAKEKEDSRRAAILEVHAKHDKDGDLAPAALKAFSDGVDASGFKDLALEVVGGRAAQSSMKPGPGAGGQGGKSELDKIRDQIDKATDPSEKGRLAVKARKLRDA